MDQYLNMLKIVVDKPKYKNESVQGKEDKKTFVKVEKIKVEGQVSQEQLVAVKKRLINEAIERYLMTRTQLAKDYRFIQRI